MPVPTEVPAEFKLKLTPEHAEVAPDMDGVFGVPVQAEDANQAKRICGLFVFAVFVATPHCEPAASARMNLELFAAVPAIVLTWPYGPV